jgi:predicted DNA repair protein MutK
MASGLVALLDDIAGITKLAAASLDDVGAAAGKAGIKAAGVVVDDTAVTPRYVTGLSPERELPIIAKIAVGSLRNKLLILLPAALLLSAFAPWAITPLLMLGGTFLCFEGAEKLIEAMGGEGHADEDETATNPAELEKQKVSGAIRTDLILSAEIMAIALNSVSTSPILTQAVALILVAIGITAGVYGVVGLIVKMDDIGLHLSRRNGRAIQALGRGLVKGMPIVMSALATIGTVAMLWVGGGILVHGMDVLGFGAPAHLIHGASEAAAHAVPAVGGVVGWVVGAIGSGIVGIVVGGIVALVLHKLRPAR